MDRVLIVDDSKDLLEFLSLLLTKQGYEVQEASSKEELTNCLTVCIPDLILLNVRLKGEEGKELCKKVKENIFSENVPVILLSASPELLIDYGEWAAEAVIEKPFDILTVVKKIESVLSSTHNIF